VIKKPISKVTICALVGLFISGCTTNNIPPTNSQMVINGSRYVSRDDGEQDGPRRWAIILTYSIYENSPVVWIEALKLRDAESQALIKNLNMPDKIDFYFTSCQKSHGKYTLNYNPIDDSNEETPYSQTILQCKYDPLNNRYNLKVTYSYRAIPYYEEGIPESILLTQTYKSMQIKLNNPLATKLLTQTSKLIQITVSEPLLTKEERDRYTYGIEICKYSNNANTAQSSIQKMLNEFLPKFQSLPKSYLDGSCKYGFYMENYGAKDKYNTNLEVVV